MNCLDRNGPATRVAAVAVGDDCRAGICGDHANIDTHHLPRMILLGMPVAVETPGRGRLPRRGTSLDSLRMPG